jgi:DNA-binding NtrC family response regulator
MKNVESHRNVRVLLVEDSLPIRQRIRSLIEESGHCTVVGEAGSVAYALALFRTLEPDAVVLDLHLAEGEGYTVLKEIKLAHPDCEVIVLTNFAMPEHRERCRKLGADHFFEKSHDFERVPLVLAALGRVPKRSGRILIADDELLVGLVLTQLLHTAGYDCERVANGVETIQALSRSRFDLLIADVNMPGNRHLELMVELLRVAPGLPVILLTGDPTVKSAAPELRLHAKAYLSKPPNLDELKLLVRESIANYRVYRAVRRKWDQFQALALELNWQLSVTADPAEFEEVEHLSQVLHGLLEAGAVKADHQAMQVGQHIELVQAVREAIVVLEKTKQVFKSKQLVELRLRLEELLGGIDLEDIKHSSPEQT